MAYKRDWLEVNPINHTKFSAQPGNVRAHKVDISDRLKGMFKGFVSGDVSTEEGVIVLPYNVQGSDPGATANKIKSYAKDVSGKAEKFLQDEDGDVMQVTSGGVLNALKIAHPVGKIWISEVSTNPNTVLGFGTWTAYGTGKILVGIDSGDPDFNTAGETGGSKTHTHGAGTYSHTHTHALPIASDVGLGAATYKLTGTATLDAGTIAITGTSASGSNVSPYIVVYIFKRTA